MDTTRALEALTRIAGEKELTQLQDILEPELFLVGGTVRDALLGLEGHGDYDLAIGLPPETILAKLESSGVHVIPTGLRHQTVTAVFENPKRHVEITTFRGPGMNPLGGVVQSDSIETDLAYRDFTINAMAFGLREKKLIDPLQGAEDLSRRLIRCCGDARKRFQEDPLRILRAVRIASVLGFSISPETAAEISSQAAMLAKVSMERIRDEVERILLAPGIRRGFEMLAEFGLLIWCIPELVPSVGCEQNRFHSADVYHHTLDVVENTEPDLILRLSALFHDVGKPHTISIDEVTGDRHFFKHETVGADITVEALKRLKFSNEIIDATSQLVRTHMRPTDAGAPGLRRLLRDTGEYYDRWRALKEADTLATNIDRNAFREHIADFDRRMEEVKRGPKLSPLSSLAIRGSDLLELGMKQCPQIGEILRALHEQVLDDPSLNSRETLLEIVREKYLKDVHVN